MSVYDLVPRPSSAFYETCRNSSIIAMDSVRLQLNHNPESCLQNVTNIYARVPKPNGSFRDVFGQARRRWGFYLQSINCLTVLRRVPDSYGLFVPVERSTQDTHTHIHSNFVKHIKYYYMHTHGDTFTSVRTTGTFRTRTETKTVISAAQYTDR